METTTEAPEPIDAARRTDAATDLETLSERVAAFRALITGGAEPISESIAPATPSRAWIASARARRY